MGYPNRAWHIVIFDVLKRGMAAVAIILHGQQLLAEERKAFSVG